MPDRRQFLFAAASAAAGIPAILRASAIEPAKGSTVMDAEHVVILMQENRSFDHAFGTLPGVRGFNDPRAIRMADGLPVWAQANAAGERFLPFRLDIKETKTTWMGSLPHGWTDQVDAAAGGRHDKWLTAKRPGGAYAKMPLTLGHHTREDIPFYYALADAFTVCDQYFCSSLTGTTPNRLHLWTGAIREKPTADSPALVRNEDCDYGAWTKWTTFPERLEDLGVSWKIYQNELTVPSGLSGEADNWLANYGDNPIEWFAQYNVRFAESHRKFLEARTKAIPAEIEAAKKQLAAAQGDAADKLRKRIADLSASLVKFEKERATYSKENFDKLTPREKSIHAKAFTTNSGDPAYRELTEIAYKDGEATRKVKVPKGDILHQFRKDVNEGKLPTVSWLVAPEKFSDHPSSAWYGSWYLSEVLDILTKNPEVWQKTVFILNYDENDGYFDHVPPFQAPHPQKPETGKVSPGIDTSVEFVEREADRKHKPIGSVRGNSIGLGFRVPMVVASPWSRGGCVCSEVFDHTSTLRFLEKLLSHKTGRKLEEANISQWRRTVCGNLMSAFGANPDAKPGLEGFLKRDEFVEQIHKAQFKKVPDGFKSLGEKDLDALRANASPSMPRQEPGVRKSNPLPYQLEVEGAADKENFAIRFEAKRELFGDRAAGSPFIAYAFTSKGLQVRHYAVAAGSRIEDSWPLADFAGGVCDIRVHGPNGFFREFKAGAGQKVDVHLECVWAEPSHSILTGDMAVILENRGQDSETFRIRDLSYGNQEVKRTLAPGESARIEVNSANSFGWYDFGVETSGSERRYAGRMETGEWGYTDPAMA